MTKIRIEFYQVAIFGVFAKFRKTHVTSVMSVVRPSVLMEKLGSTWADFY